MDDLIGWLIVIALFGIVFDLERIRHILDGFKNKEG